MSDDRHDPTADLKRSIEALTEAYRPVLQFAEAMAGQLARSVQAFFEQNRALIEFLTEVAQDPRVRAYIEARKRGEIMEPRPCYCLCGKAHPGEPGVCDMDAVTTRHFETELLGPVDVPLCAPCAAAQFLEELVD